MISLVVDSLTFDFPDDWLVTRYDAWRFYTQQFCGMRKGIKGVDMLALDPHGTVWLIEAKDFRSHPRRNPVELHEEIWKKVYDTLAALLPARCNSSEAEEQAVAKKILNGTKLRVVAHCEQPEHPSKLFPSALNHADLTQKLRAMLKPVDAHLLATGTGSSTRRLPWNVR